MNKKVVLSVLSTAFVASMATSAFAAPKAGLYLGGNVDKFYSVDALLNLSASAKTQFQSYVSSLVAAGQTNMIVYVDSTGKGADANEILEKGWETAKQDPLKAADFEDSYTEINKDGNTVGTVEPKKEFTPGDLKVESVTALNLKQIKVTFNNELDKTTAEDEAKYLLNNVALSTTNDNAELQADKKSVVITLNTTQGNNTAATFKVDGVKDVNGKSVTSDLYTLTFNDTDAPTITKTEYTSAGKVVITFSEPMNTTVIPIVRVNGNPVAASFVAGSNTQIEATVSLTKGSTASVYVAGAKDLAGNEIAIFNGSVVVPNDTTAPTITSVTQVAQDTVRFVFDEALGTSNDLVSGDVKVLKGANLYTHGAGNVSITVNKNTTVDSTGKTYDVKVDLDTTVAGDNIYASGASSQELTFLIDANAFGDAYGNTNASTFSKTLTLTKDATGPAFESAAVASNKETFELTFNEEIDSNAANIDASKLVVTDANGVRYNVVSATRKGATNGNEKVLVVDIVAGATAMTNGTYTIKLNEGAVKDIYGNNSTAATTTVTVGDSADTTKPFATIANKAGATNTFTVTFTNGSGGSADEVTAATALNLSNYLLDGAALPAGTDIYFNSAAKNVVEIVLPANSINIGKQSTGTSAILTVKNVADKAGNVVDTTNGTVTVKDNTPAVLQSAALAGDQLTLTFSESLDAGSITGFSDLNSTFKVMGGTTQLSATSATYSIDGNKVYITYTGGNWSTVKAASTVTVETYATPVLEDANDLAVRGGVKVTVTK